MDPKRAGAAVTGSRHTDRQTFDRRQRQEQFRAALALAMAFHRLTPQGRRLVPLTAPVANDASLPHFSTELLENPLTPEVRVLFCVCLCMLWEERGERWTY